MLLFFHMDMVAKMSHIIRSGCEKKPKILYEWGANRNAPTRPKIIPRFIDTHPDDGVSGEIDGGSTTGSR